MRMCNHNMCRRDWPLSQKKLRCTDCAHSKSIVSSVKHYVSTNVSLMFLCLCVSPQEQEDLALAQALAASEEEYRRQQQRQQVPGKLSRQ